MQYELEKETKEARQARIATFWEGWRARRKGVPLRSIERSPGHFVPKGSNAWVNGWFSGAHPNEGQRVYDNAPHRDRRSA